MNTYRQLRTSSSSVEDVFSASLSEYQNPIASDVMAFQIQLAASEALAIEFIPPQFRRKSGI